MLLVIANRNYSSWSLRAWLALKHTGAAFDEIVIPLFQPNTAEEIRRHSPSGRLPVLRDGDLLVWDSLAIGEYLAERFPEAQLWPEDPAARAHARSVSAEMHSGFPSMRQNLGMNIRARKQRELNPETEREVARVVALWTEARTRYGAGGPYLYGHFTVADAMYAPVVTRFVTWGVQLTGAAAEYVRTILALPSLQAWIDLARKEPWTVPQYD
ncbi:MAG: glutathione S-transferase family protein [Myxococcaceae bacterium]